MALTASQKNEKLIGQIQDRLLDMTANPQASYSLDGISYSWNEYQSMLADQLDKLIALRGKLAGPFMVRSIAR